MRTGSPAAWGSFVAGLASVATLPVAVYLTRLQRQLRPPARGVRDPGRRGLAGVALLLARRARRRASLRRARAGLATAGRVLGIIGLCMAAAALVALGVYGLLEYVGSRE